MQLFTYIKDHIVLYRMHYTTFLVTVGTLVGGIFLYYVLLPQNVLLHIDLEKADMVMGLHQKSDDRSLLSQIDTRLIKPITSEGLETYVDSVLSVCEERCYLIFWGKEWLLVSSKEVPNTGLEKIKIREGWYYTIPKYKHIFEKVDGSRDFQKKNKVFFDERFLMQKSQVALEISSHSAYKNMLAPYLKEGTLHDLGPIQMVGGNDPEGFYLSVRIKNTTAFSKTLSNSDRVVLRNDLPVFSNASWLLAARMEQDTHVKMLHVLDTVFTSTVQRQLQRFFTQGNIPDFLRVDALPKVTGTIYLTQSASGNIVAGLSTVNEEQPSEELLDIFVGAFKKHGAYDTTQIKLPDGTKSLMLEAYPEQVHYQKQEIASGSLLYKTYFKEQEIFSFLRTQTGSLLTDGIFPTENKNEQVISLQKLLKNDPFHIVGCLQDVCGGLSFQGDSVFIKLLLSQKR